MDWKIDATRKEILNDKTRYKILSCGRRWGKSYFSILFDRNIVEREFENRFPSYIGLGLYWEYEGTAWLQDTCHGRV